MFIAYAVVGILLTLGVLWSAYMQLIRNPMILDNMAHLGVPLRSLPFLSSCFIAGGLGLVAGLWHAPLGIAAAIGLVLYFAGAAVAHTAKRDFKPLPFPALYLILAAAALSLRVLA